MTPKPKRPKPSDDFRLTAEEVRQLGRDEANMEHGRFVIAAGFGRLIRRLQAGRGEVSRYCNQGGKK